MKKFLLLIPFVFVAFINAGSTQNIWAPTNGPNGLDVYTMCISNDSIICVSATNSGMYFSKDHGMTWEKKNDGLDHNYSFATSLTVSKEGNYYAIIDNNFYKLDNNSNAWHKLNDVNWNGYSVGLNDLGTIYLINHTNSGEIAYSIDNGTTFKRNFLIIYWDYVVGFVFKGNGDNFLSVKEGGLNKVYRLPDDASHLSALYTGGFHTLKLFWHPSGNLFIYDQDNGLFRLDGQNQITKMDSLDFTNAYRKIVKLKPNGNFVAYDYYADFESDSKGQNWTQKNSTVYKKVKEFSQVLFLGQEIYVTNGFCDAIELNKTSDEGNSWINFEQQFNNLSVYNLFINKADVILSSICQAGRYQFSKNNGLRWNILTAPVEDGDYYQVASTYNGKLFISTSTGLYVSSDFGATWNPFSVSGYDAFDLLIGDGGNVILLLNQVQSFMSKDGGQNWIPITNPSPDMYGEMQIATHPNGKIYFTDLLGGLFFILDPDKNEWKQPVSNFSMIDAFHISRSGKIYLAIDNTLYLCDDKLETFDWLSDSTFYSIATDNTDNIYATTAYGKCVKSSDLGNSWEDYTQGIPSNGFALCLAIDSNQYLYMGLINDNVFKTILPVSNVVATKEEKLFSNLTIQPNPASDKIKLVIHSNVKYPLTWQLYDMLGNRLLHGEANSSISTIDTEVLPNGIYLIKFGDANLPVQKLIIQH